MAPQVGLEPTTLRLTAGCSAIELLRSVAAAHDTSRLNRPQSSYQTEIHLKNLRVKAIWTAAGGQISPYAKTRLRGVDNVVRATSQHARFVTQGWGSIDHDC